MTMCLSFGSQLSATVQIEQIQGVTETQGTSRKSEGIIEGVQEYPTLFYYDLGHQEFKNIAHDDTHEISVRTPPIGNSSKKNWTNWSACSAHFPLKSSCNQFLFLSGDDWTDRRGTNTSPWS